MGLIRGHWFLLVLFAACSALTQQELDDLGKNLRISWKVKDNTKQTAYTYSEITLTNNGQTTLRKNDHWRIHFDSIFQLGPDLEQDQGVRFRHLEGTQFTIEPTSDFIDILPGRSRKIKLQLENWMTSRTDIMPKLFIAAPGLVPQVFANTVDEHLDFVEPFNRPQQLKRYDFDVFAPFSLEQRYQRFHVPGVYKEPYLRIIPKPLKMMMDTSPSFQLSSVHIHAEPKLANEAKLLGLALTAANIKLSNQVASVIYLCTGHVTVNTSKRHHLDDAYTVKINSSSKSVTITGNQPSGVFYGGQSLLQILRGQNNTLYDTEILDVPRYGYRGVMLDVGRNFFSKDDVMTLLDKMAAYKLNTFHFHLSDDEGWRLEIPGLEELTELGSQRCYDLSETKCLLPQLGSGPTNLTSGSGYYSVSDYKEILQFAADRHIEIIPEFDLPGHARAALKSMELRYERLKRQGNEKEGLRYRLIEGPSKDTSKYLSIQMFDDDAVNPCIESTYTFIGHVMDAMKTMHKDIQPLKTFNFGADEVARGAWDNSTACKLLSNSTKVNVPLVKEHFFRRVSELNRQRHLDTAAWEDGVMHDGNNMFKLNPGQVVYTYVYENVWEWGTAGRAYNLSNHGYKVIVCPATLLNFDFPFEPDPQERGYYWATRYIDSRKAFGTMPENLYASIDTKRSGVPISYVETCGYNDEKCPPLLKPENIAGIQGQLWADTLRYNEDLQMRGFPRILSLAERAWHEADWEPWTNSAARDAARDLDWLSFSKAVGLRELPWLDSQGVKYRVAPPAARLVNGKLRPATEFPGFVVQQRNKNGVWQDVVKYADTDKPLRTRTRDGNRFSRIVQYNPFPHFIDQPTLDELSRSLDIRVNGINLDSNCTLYTVEVRITNIGTQSIRNGNWGIYFNSQLAPENFNANNNEIRLRSMADLFVLEPTQKFQLLQPNQAITVFWNVAAGTMSFKYSQMPNWFVSAEGMTPKLLNNTVENSMNFVREHDYNASTCMLIKTLSPGERYKKNAVNITQRHQKPFLPTPASFSYVKSPLQMNLSFCCWDITSDPTFAGEVTFLTEQLSKIGLPSLKIVPPSSQLKRRYIQMSLNSSLAKDEYTIQMDPAHQIIRIQASSVSSAFNGGQSIIKLALGGAKVGVFPAVDVADSPRFKHRGLALDVSSHFFPKETVFKVLDMMALYKMNTLQLHLAHNTWRLHIPGLPELTQYGSKRCFDQVWERCTLPEYGSGPFSQPNQFYTQKDYRDILKYAARRHIEIIPEFNIPTKAYAGIASMALRKQSMLDKGDFNESKDLLLETFNSDILQMSNPSDALDLDNFVADPYLPSTFKFVSRVFEQVCRMHKDINPLRVFHVGGYDMYKVLWGHVHAGNLKSVFQGSRTLNDSSVQRSFLKGLAQIVSSRHVSLGAVSNAFQSELNDTVDVLPISSGIGHPIVNEWFAPVSFIQMANMDYKIVRGASDHLLMNTRYEPDPTEKGLYGAAGYLDTKKVFGFRPLSDRVPASLLPPLTGRDCLQYTCVNLTKPENVIGIQGVLTTERIRTEEELFSVLLPRMIAVAERAWHKASWEDGHKTRWNETDEWLDFAFMLGHSELRVLDRTNFTYYIPAPGARLTGKTLTLNTEFPGLPVEVSYNGGLSWTIVDPASGSQVLSPGQTVVARTRSPLSSRRSKEVHIVEIVGK